MSLKRQPSDTLPTETNFKKTYFNGKIYNRSNWDDALLRYCDSPENFPNLVVNYSDTIVIMNDLYPKARYHYLVLPRDDIEGLADLKRSHAGILIEMKIAADCIVASHPCSVFKIGFHAVPSMKRLHMHVISTDFASNGLKNKKHWNSFNTDFFKSYEEIVDLLELDGEVVFTKKDYEKLLERNMLCNACAMPLKNMPFLKAHQSNCEALAVVQEHTPVAEIPEVQDDTVEHE